MNLPGAHDRNEQSKPLQFSRATMVMCRAIHKIVVVSFRQTLVALSGAEVINPQLSGVSEFFMFLDNLMST